MIYNTINTLFMLFNISLKVLYFDNLYCRLFLPQTGNTSERPVGLQIEAFVLDL